MFSIILPQQALGNVEAVFCCMSNAGIGGVLLRAWIFNEILVSSEFLDHQKTMQVFSSI